MTACLRSCVLCLLVTPCACLPQVLPKLPQVQEAMIRYFNAQQADRAGLGLELLPGVQRLLEALQVGLFVCLLVFRVGLQAL